MPRFFNNTTEYIRLSIGACGITPGNLTIVFIAKLASDNAWEDILIGDDGAGADAGFVLQKSDNLGGAVNAIYFSHVTGTSPTDSWSTFNWTVADGWILGAVSTTAGATTPVFHKYVFSTRVWTHSNGFQAFGGDSAAAPSRLTIGESGTSNSMSGDIAAIGVWDAALTNAQVEMMAESYNNFTLYSPKGVWILNQPNTSTTVYDLTGNGANETAISGTAVSVGVVPFRPMKVKTMRPDAFSPGLAR